MGVLFTKTLRDQRRALIGWGVGVVALVLVEGAFWPSLRDMKGLDEFLSSYPKGLQKLFNMDAMTTGTGFFNAEVYTLMLPVLFIIFGITRGSRLIAGEEADGTLDVLLVTPLSTTRLYLEKAAALLVAIVVLGVVAALATLVASASFGLGISWTAILVGTLAMVLIGVEFGWLALSVGAMTGRRSAATGTAAVTAVAAYVLYVAGLMVDGLHQWLPWSPFQQALAAGPLDASVPAQFGWLLAGGVLALLVAPPLFARRDVGVH
jgi:ABC-2 type transport system permease protein